MKNTSIVVTRKDYRRLVQLLGLTDKRARIFSENLNRLANELQRAIKVDSEKVDPDVVTMNSVIEFTDMDNNITKQIKLVYPHESDIRKGYISVTAPVGTAILGFRKGDIIEWDVPVGKKKFLIRNILYQPEANGDFMA